MVLNDIIGDSLTRIRNSYMRNQEEVVLKHSRIVESLVGILQKEGYVGESQTIETKNGLMIKVALRYEDNKPVIRHIKRISKPGLRKYLGYKSVPRVLNGLGVAILSTPEGIITGKEAKLKKVGGELLCTVY